MEMLRFNNAGIKVTHYMFSNSNKFGIIIIQLFCLVLFIVLTSVSLELMWIRYFDNAKQHNSTTEGYGKRMTQNVLTEKMREIGFQLLKRNYTTVQPIRQAISSHSFRMRMHLMVVPLYFLLIFDFFKKRLTKRDMYVWIPNNI